MSLSAVEHFVALRVDEAGRAAGLSDAGQRSEPAAHDGADTRSGAGGKEPHWRLASINSIPTFGTESARRPVGHRPVVMIGTAQAHATWLFSLESPSPWGSIEACMYTTLLGIARSDGEISVDGTSRKLGIRRSIGNNALPSQRTEELQKLA